MYIRHGAFLRGGIAPITEGKRLLDVEGCEECSAALQVVGELLAWILDLKSLKNRI